MSVRPWHPVDFPALVKEGLRSCRSIDQLLELFEQVVGPQPYIISAVPTFWIST